jgi:hypothetical protein
MAHIRKEIRDDIKTTLTGLATTGENVFQSRVYPMRSNNLPCILIFNKSEQVAYSSIGIPRLQERLATYDVEVYVKGTSGYDDTLDAICVEIEEALATDITRGGDAIDTQIVSFESEFNGDGDQPVAYCKLTVEVKYQVRENNPDVSI